MAMGMAQYLRTDLPMSTVRGASRHNDDPSAPCSCTIVRRRNAVGGDAVGGDAVGGDTGGGDAIGADSVVCDFFASAFGGGGAVSLPPNDSGPELPELLELELELELEEELVDESELHELERLRDFTRVTIRVGIVIRIGNLMNTNYLPLCYKADNRIQLLETRYRIPPGSSSETRCRTNQGNGNFPINDSHQAADIQRIPV